MSSFPISLPVGNFPTTDPRSLSSCSSSLVGTGARRLHGAANSEKETPLFRADLIASLLDGVRNSSAQTEPALSGSVADSGDLKAADKALALSAAGLLGGMSTLKATGAQDLVQDKTVPEIAQEALPKEEDSPELDLTRLLYAGAPAPTINTIVGQPAAATETTAANAATSGQTEGQSLKILLDRLSSLFKKLAGNVFSKSETSDTDTSQSFKADAVYLGGMREAADLFAATQSAQTAKAAPGDLKDLFINSGLNGLDTVYLDVKNIVSDSADQFQSLGLQSLSAVVDKLETLLEQSTADSEHSARHQAGLQALHAMENRLPQGGAAPVFSVTPHSAANTALQESTSRLATIQQVQSAMADMVERMKGDVSFDTPMRRAVIYLDPPALGRLHIQMTIDDSQRVVAQIQADQSATQDFLRQNREDLRRGFSNGGYDPEQVDVRFVDDADGFTV